MADTGELGDQLIAARPSADDARIEALVAARLFGDAQLGPAKIDRFTLLERIGRGGTGDVFAAYDPVLDRKVALKVLRADAGIDRLDADERGWLLREARAAARLAHPNVVGIYEVGELGDGIFVAMEHIEGVTLRAWLRERRSLEAILEVFVQVGRGLAAAHEAGVIHRDFKPENVLVCGEGPDLRGRVVDFGLARMVEWRIADERASGGGGQHSTLMGTPAYMAPEQLRERTFDARSDQFSFCVALHEALTREHPFGADRQGTTVEQLLARMLDDERPSGERALPSWLRPILRRGLALDPADRFPSMRALVRTLEATPSRRKRRLVVVAVLALGIASSALTISSLDKLARDHCAEVDAELQGIWDENVRAAARSAFAKLELANGADAWGRLELRIDNYARAWLASREQSCRGRLGSSELSPELAALRNACLDRRRAELAGLTELLGSANKTTILGALNAVEWLTPVSNCDDLESLRREAAAVEEDETPDAHELRRQLLWRIPQVRAGHAREVGPAVKQLVERARALAIPGLLAESLALRALVEEMEGDYDAAAASLEQAVLEAIAARHDRMHAEIAVRLVWIHGVRRREPALAQAWVARAEAAIRASRSELPLRARLLEHRGALASLEHDYRAAERAHREALAIYRQLPPQPSSELQASSELLSSIANLGGALLMQGKTTEAIALFEEALAGYREHFWPNHPNIAAALANLGHAYMLAGEHERGLAALHEALELKQQVFGPDHVELLKTLDQLGNAYSQLGRNAEARAMFERGLEIGEREHGPDSPHLEHLLYSLAFEAWLAEDHEAVVRHATRVLAIQRRVYGEQHPTLALTCELLARGQLGIGDEQAADATIDQALALADGGQLGPLERGNLLLSAAWIKRANGAPEPTVRALASSAREQLGEQLDPIAARELAELLGSAL